MNSFIKIATNYLCAIPFIGMLCCVFIIDNSLVNGIVIGKYFWFYFMVGLMSLSALILYAINKPKLNLSTFDALFILFFILGAIITYSYNQDVTTKLIIFILLFVSYLYYRIYIQQEKRSIYILSISFIIIGIIESIWGLKQLYGFSLSHHAIFNTTGSFFNPGPYAGYLAVVLPISLYYMLNDWRITSNPFHKSLIPFYIRLGTSILAFIGIILILPATMSRASWLAAILGCLFIFIYKRIGKYIKLRNISLYIKANKVKAFVVSIVIVVIIIITLCTLYNLKKNSADGRFFIWKIALNTISEHPFGVGIGNFAGVYGKQQANYFALGQFSEQEELIAGNPEYAFNEFIQVCIELGIIPFLLMVTIFIYAIILGIRNNRIAHVGSLIAFLVFASMSYPFSVLPFLIVLIWLISVCVLESQGTTIISCRYKTNKVIVSAILFVSCVLTFLCFNNRYPTYEAHKNWKEASMFYNLKMYEKALNEYEILFAHLSDQTLFLFEYAQCLSKTSHFEESNKIIERAVKISCDPMLYNVMGNNYQALKQYKHAEECFLQASYIVPNRMYPYYLLFMLYDEINENYKAKQIGDYIIKKKVKVDSPAVKEMKKKISKILEQKI